MNPEMLFTQLEDIQDIFTQAHHLMTEIVLLLDEQLRVTKGQNIKEFLHLNAQLNNMLDRLTNYVDEHVFMMDSLQNYLLFLIGYRFIDLNPTHKSILETVPAIFGRDRAKIEKIVRRSWVYKFDETCEEAKREVLDRFGRSIDYAKANFCGIHIADKKDSVDQLARMFRDIEERREVGAKIRIQRKAAERRTAPAVPRLCMKARCLAVILTLQGINFTALSLLISFVHPSVWIIVTMFSATVAVLGIMFNRRRVEIRTGLWLEIDKLQPQMAAIKESIRENLGELSSAQEIYQLELEHMFSDAQTIVDQGIVKVIIIAMEKGSPVLSQVGEDIRRLRERVPSFPPVVIKFADLIGPSLEIVAEEDFYPYRDGKTEGDLRTFGEMWESWLIAEGEGKVVIIGKEIYENKPPDVWSLTIHQAAKGILIIGGSNQSSVMFDARGEDCRP